MAFLINGGSKWEYTNVNCRLTFVMVINKHFFLQLPSDIG